MSRALHLGLLAPLLFLCLGAGVRPPGLGDVTGVRFAEHETYTRIVIELSREAAYTWNEISKPDRLYIDVDETWVEEPQRTPQELWAGAPILRVRGGQNTLRRARFVLELSGRQQAYKVYHLENPFRIVTDIYTDGRFAPPDFFASRPVRRVVIDAGHGGKDPGAVGPGRRQEKIVVMRIARELRGRLEREGFDVTMTREYDRDLPLVERTDRANRADGDLFISIHANASRNRRAQGVETYLLDTRYDRQTARVAARENGVSVAKLQETQKILASLKLGYTERYAAPLATSVQKSLVKRLRSDYPGTRDVGVKRGPFLVLFHADMPSVLVEVGFITNRGEAKRINSVRFARAAAEGIAAGVIRSRDLHARNLVAER